VLNEDVVDRLIKKAPDPDRTDLSRNLHDLALIPPQQTSNINLIAAHSNF